MVINIAFVDIVRQEQIETFYDVCQKQRDYYRGRPKSYHPYQYFRDPNYLWQCPPNMSETYLSFPPYHVGYKHPLVTPQCHTATSRVPDLPTRSLAGRYNKNACLAYVR